MPARVAVALTAITAIAATMLFELRRSRSNERALRARGAIEPPDDVHSMMTWAYPACFAAMAIEGALVGPAPGTSTVAGVILLAAAKALKYWAMTSLGSRWSFRVLVVPGAPLVTHGPYAWLRHPNYLAVVGELVGLALTTGALVTGVLSIVGFGSLIRRRIAVEERALGIARTGR